MIPDPIPLVCPRCLGTIVRKDDAFRCAPCAATFPVRDRVHCFMAGADEFYEGHYEATVNLAFAAKPSLKSFLYFSLYRDPYHRALRRHLADARSILDLGCGGGIRYLANHAAVAGVDLSFSSLKKAAEFYQLAIQADALKLPFPANAFDLVASSFSFEHFRPEEKELLLDQLARVLKPGGKIVMQFDCDNQNRLFRWLKQDPELYRAQFIEHDHHYGLEPASVNLQRLRDHGFTIREQTAVNKTPLQYLPAFGWMAPYAAKSKIAAAVTRLLPLVNSKKALWVPYHALVNWWDLIVEPALPLDYARILVVVAEKPK